MSDDLDVVVDSVADVDANSVEDMVGTSDEGHASVKGLRVSSGKRWLCTTVMAFVMNGNGME